mmetsp:Transcript_36937/g.47739  ORF Transcript_36937/g.47739 Transcript_36937/m.47739 type:complete len:98 (-) Transcript_36937:158-451(-)
MISSGEPEQLSRGCDWIGSAAELGHEKAKQFLKSANKSLPTAKKDFKESKTINEEDQTNNGDGNNDDDDDDWAIEPTKTGPRVTNKKKKNNKKKTKK